MFRMSPSWKTNLLVSGGAFLISVGLSVVVGEVVLRSVAPKSDAVKLGVVLPHSARQYGLQPNVRSLQTGVEVVTNSLGFREKDYPVAKASGVRRIVVLGDSYTFGVGVRFEDTFSKRLEVLLNTPGGAYGYEVINFGVNGYNTVQELATLQEVAAAFGPDLVIVAYVLNDAERMPQVGNQYQEPPPEWSFMSAISAVHVALKKKSMLYSYLSPKINGVFGLFGAAYWMGLNKQIIRLYDDSSLGWAESRQALLEIAQHARAIKAEILVVVLPYMTDFRNYPVTSVHDKITQFCRAHGINVLDLLPRFRNEPVSEFSVFLDGHPNATAHRVFADGILARLAAGLGGRAERAP